MGAIVEFKQLQSRSRKAQNPVPAEGAQILFFIGVRYERHEAPVAAKPPRKRNGNGLAAPRKKSPRRRA